MYKSIYDCFSHWYRGGQIYFYSDPHFSDSELFASRQITDDEQVKCIRSKIGKLDTLVILGDVGNPEPLKQIKGYKVLICGNHDAGTENYKEYFNEIYEGPVFLNEKILLSHEPCLLPFVFNIHGHIHDYKRFKENNSLNVCAEAIDYYPVSFSSLLKSGAFAHITSLHRMTIDKATARRNKK